jgi:tetratricopeptide (TPR) repeat protein
MTTLEQTLQELFKPGPLEIQKLVETHFEGDADHKARLGVEFAGAAFGTTHPDYATHLNNLAGVVRAQGRYDEAEGLYREALEIDRATVGEEHPDYAIDLVNLGRLLGQTGRVAEGRGMLEQALAIFRAALPEGHPHIAETQRRLAALPASED